MSVEILKSMSIEILPFLLYLRGHRLVLFLLVSPIQRKAKLEPTNTITSCL